MALFGEKGPTRLGIDKLYESLNALFDERLKAFSQRAARLVSEWEAASKEFLYECDRFDRLNVKLELEYGWMRNVAFIESEKPIYAATLRNIIGSSKRAENAENSRERYYIELSSMGLLVDQLMAANTKHRQVVTAYGRYLKGFQNALVKMQRIKSQMEIELERTAPELEQYELVRSKILSLTESIEKRKILEQELSVLESSGSHIPAGQQKGMDTDEKSKEQKEVKLRAARERKAALSTEVNNVVASLDKLARLYDHLSPKFKFGPFIEDPIGTLSDAESYREFMNQLNDLESKAKSGALKVKSIDDAVSRISRIRDYDVFGKVSELAMLAAEERVCADEIREYEKARAEIERVQAESKRKSEGINSAKIELKTITENMAAEKAETERLFKEHYGKTLEIVTG